MAKTISFVKGKGSISHDNRDFIADNVDRERISWNETYVKQSLEDAYEYLFGDAVREYNDKQKRSDRKIDGYLTKIKNSRNNEKQFYENVVQIGKMDDTGVLDSDGKLSEEAKLAREILDEYARTFQERNPNLYLFNAVLHMDEATPHLHLDYIPVAHGYKTGLKTRNSLTKGLQEMGIAPAVGKKDNETMHWQERERAYLRDLCLERGLEIETLGESRDDYSIPEYKKAMREKEAAEAEVEILTSQKIGIEAEIATMGVQLKSDRDEEEERRKALKDIKDQISEAEKTIEAKEKTLDKIISAGKPVEKEIKEIQSKVSEVPSFFGGEKMVKLPKKIYDQMISRYRVAGTFENLNKSYASDLNAKQKKNDSLTEQVNDLKKKIRQYTEFVEKRGLVEAFKEFIKPKTLRERLQINKKKAEIDNDRRKVQTISRSNRNDIAI